MIKFSSDEINITLDSNPNKISSFTSVKKTKKLYRLEQEIKNQHFSEGSVL